MSRKTIPRETEKPKKLTRAQKKEIDAVIRKYKGDGKPRTAQATIPYEAIYPDGVCRIDRRTFSKCIAFEDISYQLAQPETRTAIFEHLCDLYNYVDASIHVQLSFLNRKVDPVQYAKSFEIAPQGDDFDDIRAEYTAILQKQLASGNNGIVKTKYLTFTIFNVFNVTMNNIVSSEGAAKTTMCALLLGAVLNIGLDPLFIYILDMGVEGAAIATAISQMVSTLVYLTYVLRKKSVFTFSIKEFSPTRQMMAEILKIGVPTLVFQLLTSLSIALINRASSNYGDSVIAGMGAVTRITSMGTLVVFGFLKGFQPIAGFSYGAKKFDRLREAIKTSIIWSTSFCLVVGLVMAVFSMQIISQFTKGDTQMILVGQKSLFANGITFILFGFYTVYSSLFLALGKGAAGFFLGACRQGVCFVPVILLLPMVWGMNGILYAQPIADVISVVITVFMALHLHRELSMAEKQVMSNSEM